MDDKTVSSGILPLDLMLGRGGFPRGAMVEVSGDWHACQVLIQGVLAEADRTGSTSLVTRAHEGDAQVLKQARSAVRTIRPDVIIVDGVEVDDSAGRSALACLQGTVRGTTTCVVANSIGATGRDSTSQISPWRHCAVRLTCRASESLEDDRIAITVTRNPGGPSFRSVMLDPASDRHLSRSRCVLTAGVAWGLIEYLETAARFVYDGIELGSALVAAARYLDACPELMDGIEVQARRRAASEHAEFRQLLREMHADLGGGGSRPDR